MKYLDKDNLIIKDIFIKDTQIKIQGENNKKKLINCNFIKRTIK